MEDVEARIREVISGYAPGLSVAVVRPEGVRWQRGFGRADLTTGAATTPDTVYLWFSMTKIVTATAAMQLLDRGSWDSMIPSSGTTRLSLR